MSVDLKDRPSSESDESSQPKQPVVRMILLSDLVVPDWNPRKFKDPAEMRTLQAYMAKGGYIHRLLVWKGNGQAPYPIISGQRRFLAAGQLGWPQIECEELDITLEEAKIMAITSNAGAEVYWLDKYESWESVMKDHTDWTQDIWADKFGVEQQAVSRAKRLLTVLNGPARALIHDYMDKLEDAAGASSQNASNPQSSGDSGVQEEGSAGSIYLTSVKSLEERDKLKSGNDDPWVLSENVAYQLVRLLAIKPPEKAQDLAYQSLQQILTNQMAAPQARALVQKHLEQAGVLTQKLVAKPTEMVETVTGMETKQSAVAVPASPQAADSPMGSVPGNHIPKHVADGHGLPQMNKGQERLVKGILSGIHWVIKAVGAVLKALFWTPFKGAVHDLAKPAEGFMRFVWFWVIVLALLWAAYDRIFHPGDLTARFKNLVPTMSEKGSGGGGIAPKEGAPVSVAQVNTPSVAKPSSPAKPSNDGQSLQSLSNRKSPDVPEELNDRMKNDAEDDADLAKTFFELSYHMEYEDWQRYFDGKLSTDYSEAFYQKYFSKDRQDEVKEGKMYMVFESSQPPKLLKFDDFSDDFLVQGVLTTRSDLTYPKKLISRKKVGLIVETYHNSDGSEAVVKVTEVNH